MITNHVKKNKIVIIAGTRPEIIKLGLIIKKCRGEKSFQTIVISTGQHIQLAAPFWKIFEITPDYNLNLMVKNQTHSLLSAKIINKLTAIFRKELPDLVVVQGDTTTAAIASLTSFQHQIPVAHVEAGLRTYDLSNPYPEELNRRIIDLSSTLLFTPTLLSKNNLLEEKLGEKKIYVTGNTVIDALYYIIKKNYVFQNRILSQLDFHKKVVILTTHRREAYLSKKMANIFTAVNYLIKKYKDLVIVYPIHPNPQVRNLVHKYLKPNSRLLLTNPLNYFDMVKLIKNCYLILSDSGGLQEEAPTFGKPLLILRLKTERMEGVIAGNAKLVGLNKENIIQQTALLLENGTIYNQMSKVNNPYGDGKASDRIIQIMKEYLRS